MKRLIAAVAIILGALGLTACGHYLNHGTITGKEYSPESTYVTTTCMAYGKYGCTWYMPVTYTDPAEWVLDLKDGKQTGSTDVDEATWDRVKVGERYP